MSAASSSTPTPAQAYEQYQVPALFGPFAVDMVARAGPQAGERVLDLACGTGVVARRLATLVAPGGRVDALDLNAGMLSVARDVAARDGVEITFHLGDMQALHFADGSYDLVTCHQGLQFVPDRAAAVREMRRVLHDDGRAVASCWGAIEDNPLYVAMAPIVARHAGQSALDAPFALSSAEALCALFTTAGFSEVQFDVVQMVARYPDPDQFVSLFITATVASISALHEMTPAAREELIVALSDDLFSTLQAFIDGDEVLSPRETHVVRAYA